MARRGLRLSQLPPMRTLKPKAAKTPAHQMAEKSKFIRPPKLTHEDTRIRIELFNNAENEYD